MTGYAASVVQQDGLTVRVSLRSVNHRYLDLRLHLPEELLPLENRVRKGIQERNPRGHLDLKVQVEREGQSGLAINENLIGQCVEQLRRLGAQYGLAGEPDLASLAQLPGMISITRSAPGPEVLPALEAVLSRALGETLDRWDQMRAEEARLLAADLTERLQRVREAVQQIEQLQPGLLPQAQKKLRQRLETLLGSAALDASRWAQEAAVLVDRTDASEEIQRLKAHLAQFARLLEEGTDAGRKLDFLLQEMQRELNTLLSKTTGLGECSLPITQLGLDIRVEVEKIREQTQNFE